MIKSMRDVISKDIKMKKKNKEEETNKLRYYLNYGVTAPKKVLSV